VLIETYFHFISYFVPQRFPVLLFLQYISFPIHLPTHFNLRIQNPKARKLIEKCILTWNPL